VKQLKVAVIGCGSWGYHHARVYTELPHASLEAVVDINPERIQKISRMFHCKGYTSPVKMFKDIQVEAVSICTPTITHYELAHLALMENKHVLVEKPMTNTSAEARKLTEIARKNDVFLSVGFIERYNPAVQESKKMVTKGDIGDVLIAHAKRVTRRPIRVGDIGVIKDLGIHDIDIINHIMGDPPEKVYATLGNHNHCFEDYANVILSYKGGRSGFIETNWLTPKRVRSLIITGTEGIIELEYTSQELKLEKNDHIYQPLNGYKEPLFLELSDFTSAILEKRSPLVTGEEGLQALKVCEAALESSKTGSVVYMDGETD